MTPQRPPRIIRTVRDKDHPYKVINVTFANDRTLSAEARGVMVFLLTKPDDWRIVPEALRKEFELGRDKLYRILGELGDAGYLHRERRHDDKGRIVWGDYVLYENPADAPPSPEKPDMVQGDRKPSRPFPEKPDTVQPDTALPYTENTDMVKTEVQGDRTPSRPFPENPYAYIKSELVIDPPPPTPSSDSLAAAPPFAEGGGGGKQPIGPGRNSPQVPPGARYLSDEGFGDWAIENLGHLPVEVLRADVERRRKKGAGEGAIVRAWKACPPSSTPSSAAPPPRQSDLDVIRFYPDPVVVGRWLPKARAEGANIPAIVAAFVKEHPDALSSPAPHG